LSEAGDIAAAVRFMSGQNGGSPRMNSVSAFREAHRKRRTTP
jgi:hypothetical protein